jgi:hypothetical protein
MSHARVLAAVLTGLAALAPLARAQAPALDLASFPLPAGAEATGPRRPAQLGYSTPEAVEPAYRAAAKALAGRGWAESPGGYVTPQAASGSFQKGAWRLSVTVMPGSDPKRPGGALVTLNQHGDVDLAALPLPAGVKSVYVGPALAMYGTAAPAADTAAALREKLLAAGWAPYGDAGDTRFYKRGSVRLSATVAAMPAQPGQTSIQLASELLSADLPLVPDATRAQYADTTMRLSFDTKAAPDAVFAFYRKALGAAGYTATTENPVRDGFKTFLIFRNAAGDLRTLEVHTVDGLTRGDLAHQTAAEVAAIDERVKAKIAAKAQEKPAAMPVVAVPIPAGARGVTRTDRQVEFQVAAGSARAAVAAIRQALTVAGWVESKPIGDATAGTTTFEKAGASVTVLHADPGFIPAEITVTASGATLAK